MIHNQHILNLTYEKAIAKIDGIEIVIYPRQSKQSISSLYPRSGRRYLIYNKKIRAYFHKISRQTNNVRFDVIDGDFLLVQRFLKYNEGDEEEEDRR